MIEQPTQSERLAAFAKAVQLLPIEALVLAKAFRNNQFEDRHMCFHDLDDSDIAIADFLLDDGGSAAVSRLESLGFVKSISPEDASYRLMGDGWWIGECAAQLSRGGLGYS